MFIAPFASLVMPNLMKGHHFKDSSPASVYRWPMYCTSHHTYTLRGAVNPIYEQTRINRVLLSPDKCRI